MKWKTWKNTMAVISFVKFGFIDLQCAKGLSSQAPVINQTVHIVRTYVLDQDEQQNNPLTLHDVDSSLNCVVFLFHFYLPNSLNNY